MSVLAAERHKVQVPPAVERARWHWSTRHGMGALIGVCCLLAAAYSFLTPAFEAPDEPGHYAYVGWLLAGNGVPLQGSEPLPLQPEFSQPPLYYLIQAPVAWLAGQTPANLPDWEAHHNPWQNRTAYGNVNLYYHQPSEAFPWSGAVLGLHLMRLVNLLFLALGVGCTFGCAIELGLSKGAAWLAAAGLGLIPQVLFLSGVLNADNAIWSLSAASLYLLLRWLNRGPDWQLAALLGLAAGGAALSKLSGLIPIALALAFMGLRSINTRSRRAARDLGLTGVFAAGLAGWWYARNWLLLGDPLGWNSMLLAIADMYRQPPLGLGQAMLALLQRSYTGLAVFGWTNIPVHYLAYWIFDAICVAGLIGLVWAVSARSNKLRDLRWLLAVIWPVAFFISLARWVEINTAADQWRLLFPAYPALAVLVAAGLWHLLPYWKALLAIPAGLLALNIGSMALAIAPAYAAPEPYSGPIDHVVNIRYGDFAQLVGYSTPKPLDAKPGDYVELDLFWHVLSPPPLDYGMDMGTVDAHDTLTWKEFGSPDEGRAAMSLWRPGELIRDRHRIPVKANMQGFQKVLMSLFRPTPPGDHVPATGPDGRRLNDETAEITRFLVLPASAPSPAAKDSATFADGLELAGHTVAQSGGQLALTLDWKTLAPPSKDYTVFAHLLAPDGRVVGQNDGQPNGGEFPTSLLLPGAEVPDRHVFDVGGLPAGQYTAEVGVYELASGQRLALSSGGTSLTLPVTVKPSP